MDKQYVIPESEEIKIRFENNIMSGAEGEGPDIPPGPGEE
jgi:hypothetical protein